LTTEKVVVRTLPLQSPEKLLRRSQGLSLLRYSIHRILKNNLGQFPYKSELFQQMRPPNRSAKLRFQFQLLALKENLDFYTKLMSDEAIVQLIEIVN
jgi:hypothetical protein